MLKNAPSGDNGIVKKNSAAPHDLSAKNDQGKSGNSSERNGQKNVCSCSGCRKDSSVAVSVEDKKYLDDLTVAESKKAGRQVTVKETLAGILTSHREGASA
jgi:hypothetical protein